MNIKLWTGEDTPRSSRNGESSLGAWTTESQPSQSILPKTLSRSKVMKGQTAQTAVNHVNLADRLGSRDRISLALLSAWNDRLAITPSSARQHGLPHRPEHLAHCMQPAVCCFDCEVETSFPFCSSLEAVGLAGEREIMRSRVGSQRRKRSVSRSLKTSVSRSPLILRPWHIIPHTARCRDLDPPFRQQCTRPSPSATGSSLSGAARARQQQAAPASCTQLKVASRRSSTSLTRASIAPWTSLRRALGSLPTCHGASAGRTGAPPVPRWPPQAWPCCPRARSLAWATQGGMTMACGAKRPLVTSPSRSETRHQSIPPGRTTSLPRPRDAVTDGLTPRLPGDPTDEVSLQVDGVRLAMLSLGRVSVWALENAMEMDSRDRGLILAISPGDVHAGPMTSKTMSSGLRSKLKLGWEAFLNNIVGPGHLEDPFGWGEIGEQPPLAVFGMTVQEASELKETLQTAMGAPKALSITMGDLVPHLGKLINVHLAELVPSASTSSGGPGAGRGGSGGKKSGVRFEEKDRKQAWFTSMHHSEGIVAVGLSDGRIVVIDSEAGKVVHTFTESEAPRNGGELPPQWGDANFNSPV